MYKFMIPLKAFRRASASSTGEVWIGTTRVAIGVLNQAYLISLSAMYWQKQCVNVMDTDFCRNL